jgi:TPR repeat protein
VVVLALAATSACGKPGTVGEAVRPDAPEVQKTLCDSVADFGQPLIVDLKAHERAVYEAVMKDGVAVVRYDCSRLEIMKDCRLEGDYGFVGVSPKEEMVRLEGADEIRLNLPSFGAKLAAEVSRDSSLDLGMVMVGMRRTTVTEGDRARLAGNGCDKATHFVRGAFVGAFALKQGSRGSVSGALEVFGAGTSSSSSSSKRTENRDGDASACKKQSSSANEPDPSCSALLRLELTALDVKPPEHVGTIDVCPKDLVLVNGKCAPPTASTPFQCREGQLDECEAQCEKGHIGSCAAAGFLYFGSQSVPANPEKAAALSAKACDGGSARGCSNLGHAYERGEALNKDLEKARALYEKGCDGGFARGCTNLGVFAERASDPTRANMLFDRACEAGDGRGCHYLALNVDKGKGIAQDPTRAKALFSRACQGKFPDACALLAAQLVGGTEEERQKGVKELDESCAAGTASACRFLGTLRRSGTKVPKDATKALRDFERGCDVKDTDSCVEAAALAFLGGDGLAKDPERAVRLAKKACDSGNRLGCRLFAAGQLQGAGVKKDDSASAVMLEKSCADGDGESCAAAGILYRDGYGVGRSTVQALGLFEKSCQARYGYGCALLATSRLDGAAGGRDTSGARDALSRSCSYGYSPACGQAYTAPKQYAVNTFEEAQALFTSPGKTSTTAAGAPPSSGSSTRASVNPKLEERRTEVVKRFKQKISALRACKKKPFVYDRSFLVSFSVATDGKAAPAFVPSSGDPDFDSCLKKTVSSLKLKSSEWTITGVARIEVPKKGNPIVALYLNPDPSEFTIPSNLRRFAGCACNGTEAAVVCAVECRRGPPPNYMASFEGTGTGGSDPYNPFTTTTAAAAAPPPSRATTAADQAKPKTTAPMAPPKSKKR